MKSSVLCRLLVALLFVFVMTSAASTIYIGMEDMYGGDNDLNDLIIAMTSGNLSVISNGAGAWQPMVAPNEDGTPYWDNPSYDGAQMNTGYFVTGTGGYVGNPYSPNIPISSGQYWANGTVADNSFLLFSTGSTSAKVLVEVTGWPESDQLYWFNAAAPTTMNLLVPGSATPGATANFSPSGIFGLKFVSLNMAATTNCNGGQFDLFRETPSNIPEPATTMLFGAGLLALGAFRRWRKQQKC